MPIKVSAALLGLILVAGIAFGAYKVLDTVTAEHDGWDIFAPVDVAAPPLTVEPGDLLGKEDRETIEKTVMAGRTDWGLPMSVVVVEASTIESGMSAEEAASERLASEPVESREEAGDGLLLLVVVPESDPAAATVAFAAGPNFYPRGGITTERLQFIADVQMQTLIDEERIGEAVVEGATWVLWTHLFEPTPDAAASPLERGLRDLLVPVGAAGIATLALIVAGAALVILALTWRGSGRVPGAESLDAVLAGAVARGRVDTSVLAGTVLDALDRGALTVDGSGAMRFPANASLPRDTRLKELIEAIEQRGGQPTADAVARYLANEGSLRRQLEDELALAGALHPRSPVYTGLLRWIALAGLALGAVALIVSVMGEAASALLASVALAAISLTVLIWNERRSWTTRTGRAALHAWRQRHDAPGDRDRALFDAIVDMERVDLLPPDRSPLRASARALAPQLTA